MGGYGPMIAEGMANRATSDLARQHQLADEQRQNQNTVDMGVINNPDAQDQEKADAYNRINSRYPVGAHVQFLQDLFHPLRKAHQINQGIQAQSQANAVTNTPSSTPAPPSYSSEDAYAAPTPAPAAPAPTAQPASASAPAPPMAQVQSVARAQSPDQALSMIRGYASPAEAGNVLAQRLQDAMAKRQQEIAQTTGQYGVQEAIIRAGGNVSMQKLNAEAQLLGAQDFASATPDIKDKAIKALHSANVTQSWKSVQDGNNIYAVDAHDPNGARTLIGHKDDLTSHTEYKTLQNPDGSTYLVPLTTWTKKGSSAPIIQTQDQTAPASPSAPVSANTPAGTADSEGQPTAAPASAPPTPVAQASPSQTAIDSKLNKNKSASKQVPVSANTPAGPGSTPSNLPKGAIPFGGKPSELLKSDTQQYTKAAEDANDKLKSYQNAQGLLNDPNRKTDLELVFSWVRSNVQGAGRMTNTEINQAGAVGSLPTKVQNMWSQATTGRLSPDIENQFISDIKRASDTAQSVATTLRQNVEQEQKGKPVSAKTPGGPGGGKPASAVGTITYQGKKYWVDKDRNNLGEAP